MVLRGGAPLERKRKQQGEGGGGVENTGDVEKMTALSLKRRDQEEKSRGMRSGPIQKEKKAKKGRREGTVKKFFAVGL